MGSPFVGMKNMLLVLLAFVIIPTIFATSDDVGRDNPLAPPLPSPPSNGIQSFQCPTLPIAEMVDNVLQHLKAPKFIKKILSKSAKFGSCVSEFYCVCLALKLEPLVIGCLAEKGAMCMLKSIKGPVYACTTACENSIMNAKHTLSDEAVGDFCYRNCTKSG